MTQICPACVPLPWRDQRLQLLKKGRYRVGFKRLFKKIADSNEWDARMRVKHTYNTAPIVVEVFNSPRSIVKMLLFCAALLFVAISIVADDWILSGKAWAVSWILIVVLPVVMTIQIGKWRRGGIQLRIDKFGLIFPRFCDDPIAWQDISSAALTKAYRQSQLGIRLEDGARSHYPKLATFGHRLERKLSGLDLVIPLSSTDCDTARLMEAIRLHSGGRL